MWGKITIDQSDKVFSQYIRKRDGKCKRCGSLVQFNDKGLPITHQASHFFGRANEATRHDPDNVDCLCGGCHQIWGGNDHES
jgi:5-methylcytosine-specific restriction endonuclease McrA